MNKILMVLISLVALAAIACGDSEWPMSPPRRRPRLPLPRQRSGRDEVGAARGCRRYGQGRARGHARQSGAAAEPVHGAPSDGHVQAAVVRSAHPRPAPDRGHHLGRRRIGGIQRPRRPRHGPQAGAGHRRELDHRGRHRIHLQAASQRKVPQRQAGDGPRLQVVDGEGRRARYCVAGRRHLPERHPGRRRSTSTARPTRSSDSRSSTTTPSR